MKPSAEPVRVFPPEEPGLLAGVARLAREHPYPHSVLGGAGADRYVRELAARAATPGEGWYGVGATPERLDAAAHLTLYGTGNGCGHTLWKIRHPMLGGPHREAQLQVLLSELVDLSVAIRPGSAKLVMFLGEHEEDAMSCATASEFRREACFEDYYRLGEKCLVFGRTVCRRSGPHA